MLTTIKTLSIGVLITLQILGNAGMPININDIQNNQKYVEVKDDLIDELIDECDLEDADRFLDYKISDYLKNKF